MKRTKHWEILFRNADSSMVGRRRNWGGAPELQGNMWGRIERGKCVPSVQTLYDLEKALNLPECSLVKRVNGQAETDVSQESEEKEQVGRACRELELALAANLTKSNLRKASDAISTIAKMLNDTEMFLNKK